MPLTLDGTNGVSAVQTGAVESGDLETNLDLTGKNLTLPSGAIGSGDLPAGSVIQVVNAIGQNSAKDFSRNGGSGDIYQNTGMKVDITPLYSDSIILVFCQIHVYKPIGIHFLARVAKTTGGVTTFPGANPGSNRFAGGSDNDSNDAHYDAPMFIYDIAGTTNSIEYMAQFGGRDSTFTIRLNDGGNYNSSMYAMEVRA